MIKIQDIASGLIYEKAIHEVAMNKETISRYMDSNEEFDNILRYNNYIIKLVAERLDRILADSSVIGRQIHVYARIDHRFILGDMFAKLKINY